MTVDELLRDIFGQSDLFSPSFSRWVKSSESFRVFVEKYRKKIRKKILTAAQMGSDPSEQLMDVLFELEIAYLLLKSKQFSVEYEQYGRKGPDFRITHETGTILNVEVKRIREGKNPQARFNAWKRTIAKQIYTIPSPLALYMRIGDDLDVSLDLPARLSYSLPDIVDYIKKVAVPTAEQVILVNGEERYSIRVPDFDNELVLEFRKPPWSARTLSNDGESCPIFKTGDECSKFLDLYWKILKNQVVPGMINVLAINTDSDVHDNWALRKSMHYLNKLAQEHDIEQTKQLSGVLFRGAWVDPRSSRNVLWLDKDAYHPIPEEIATFLQRMD